VHSIEGKVDGNVMLGGISEKECEWLWTGLIWLRTETIAGCREQARKGQVA